MVTVSLVSYKTGHKIDLPAWSEIAHANGALLFVDAVQALGAMEVDAASADFMCAASYKWLLGQHGLSIFFVNPHLSASVTPPYAAFRGVKDPFALDRFDRYELLPDARRFEEGMPNFPGIFVLANALEFLLSIGLNQIAEHNIALATRLLAGLIEAGVDPLTPLDPQARAAIVSFESSHAEEIALTLARRGVHVWGRDGRVRMSPHLYNTESDIDALLGALADFGQCAKLRSH